MKKTKYPAKRASKASRSGEISGVRAETLRNYNLQLLAKLIVSGKVTSRAELAKDTGLNRSTVTRLIEHMLAFGIIKEGSSRSNQTGRPAISLMPARHTYVAIGAEVGTDHIGTCVMDLSGETIAESYCEVKTTGIPPAVILEKLVTILNQLSAQLAASGLTLCGITCGFSGMVSPAGQIYVSPHLKWESVDLNLLVGQGIQSDVPVSYQNTAFLAALAENIARNKQGNALQDFIHISGISAIGAAVVKAGQVEGSLHGWSGEIGHVMVSDQDRLCSCGSSGCLDAFVDRRNLLQRSGISPDAPWEELLASLRRKEEKATDALSESGIFLGRALANYINLVDVTTVVIGGSIGKLLPYFLDSLQAELAQRVLCAKWMNIEILPSVLKDTSSLQGAAWNSLLVFLSNPESWTHPTDPSRPYYSVDQTPVAFIK